MSDRASGTAPQLSCPDCGARATGRAGACADCGYRFLEDPGRPTHSRAQWGRVRDLALMAGGVASLGIAAVVAVWGVGGDPRGTANERRAGPDVLSEHPLSGPAAERLLEERFTSFRDDDSASASCSALEPRPVHAIRWCRIRYPGGTERTVIVLSHPQGRELLIER
jgi:hypothetical protein